MPRALKPITVGQRLSIEEAILHLGKARSALRHAQATRAAEYVSRALKSAEGAARHANRRAGSKKAASPPGILRLHTMYEAIFTPHEMAVPDVCPKCGSDFKEHGSLIEGNWSDVAVSSHLNSGKVEAEGYTEVGETYFPSALACRNCDWVLDPEAVTAAAKKS